MGFPAEHIARRTRKAASQDGKNPLETIALACVSPSNKTTRDLFLVPHTRMTRPSSHKPALAAAVLIIIACASGVRPPVPTASSSGEPRSTVGQSLSVADSVFVARVDAFTRGRVAVDSLSGVVLLAHDGVPIYQLTSGLANRTTRALNNLDTKFNLGSVDKYFTRIAIWQLS